MDRKLVSTLRTVSSTISISFFVLYFPIENRIEENASVSFIPIAVNTCEGSIEDEVHALPLLTAINGLSFSGLLRPIIMASESAPLKYILEVL